ncbi:MAG: hypothetical protein GKR89_25300 [Candidatus Latescibacteria bacterium]|nr:hypothetical protein [Candidatus Latescibacterota bacterium]
MPTYRHRDAWGHADEITVIEDEAMVEIDEDGEQLASFKFIDSNTVKAHPRIMDILLEEAERLWSIDEVLKGLGDGAA